jgi:hypothetical protein
LPEKNSYERSDFTSEFGKYFNTLDLFVSNELASRRSEKHLNVGFYQYVSELIFDALEVRLQISKTSIKEIFVIYKKGVNASHLEIKDILSASETFSALKILIDSRDETRVFVNQIVEFIEKDNEI